MEIRPRIAEQEEKCCVLVAGRLAEPEGCDWGDRSVSLRASDCTLCTLKAMQDAIEKPLTAEQLSKILPLHTVTILKWAREGKIPHKRLSPRKIVFKPSEIQAWLDSKSGRIP